MKTAATTPLVPTTTSALDDGDVVLLPFVFNSVHVITFVPSVVPAKTCKDLYIIKGLKKVTGLKVHKYLARMKHPVN